MYRKKVDDYYTFNYIPAIDLERPAPAARKRSFRTFNILSCCCCVCSIVPWFLVIVQGILLCLAAVVIILIALFESNIVKFNHGCRMEWNITSTAQMREEIFNHTVDCLKEIDIDKHYYETIYANVTLPLFNTVEKLEFAFLYDDPLQTTRIDAYAVVPNLVTDLGLNQVALYNVKYCLTNTHNYTIQAQIIEGCKVFAA